MGRSGDFIGTAHHKVWEGGATRRRFYLGAFISIGPLFVILTNIADILYNLEANP